MDQDHKENIERTIVELETQQMAVQQLVAEALDDLDLVYSELEEQARLIAESGPSVDGAGEDVSDATAAASKELQTLQDDIATLQEERRELENQLSQLRQQLEEELEAGHEAGSAAEIVGDAVRSSQSNSRPTSPLVNSMPVPNSAAIHAPFDRLREALSASGTA